MERHEILAEDMELETDDPDELGYIGGDLVISCHRCGAEFHGQKGWTVDNGHVLCARCKTLS